MLPIYVTVAVAHETNLVSPVIKHSETLKKSSESPKSDSCQKQFCSLVAPYNIYTGSRSLAETKNTIMKSMRVS